jgi:hypothetical protein
VGLAEAVGAAQKTCVIMDDGESLCLPINRVICNIHYINFHSSTHGASAANGQRKQI